MFHSAEEDRFLIGYFCRKRRKFADLGITSVDGIEDTLERIDSSQITVQDFIAKYEIPKRPVVITGLCSDWPALAHWKEGQLLSKYSQHRFKARCFCLASTYHRLSPTPLTSLSKRTYRSCIVAETVVRSDSVRKSRIGTLNADCS